MADTSGNCTIPEPNDTTDADSTTSAVSTPTTSSAIFTDATSTPSHPSPVLAPLPFPTGLSLTQLALDATPWPSSTATYIILHQATQRPLTLHKGKPVLAPFSPTTPPLGCIHWTLLEKDGWFGLRNVASGTYLGRNFPGEIIATSQHHRDWEYLCVRLHPDGGYVLLNANIAGGLLEMVGIADEGWSLVLRKEVATWEFIKVDA